MIFAARHKHLPVPLLSPKFKQGPGYKVIVQGIYNKYNYITPRFVYCHWAAYDFKAIKFPRSL